MKVIAIPGTKGADTACDNEMLLEGKPLIARQMGQTETKAIKAVARGCERISQRQEEKRKESKTVIMLQSHHEISQT